MENVMYQILSLVLTIMGLVLTYYVVPWLKNKATDDKLSTVEMWVNISVSAAEQIFKNSNMGETKKTYVLEFLKSKGITITDQELDALIEAAVYEINKAKNLLFTDLALSDNITKAEAK